MAFTVSDFSKVFCWPPSVSTAIIKIAMPKKIKMPTMVARLLFVDFILLYKVIVVKTLNALVLRFKHIFKRALLHESSIQQHCHVIACGFSAGQVVGDYDGTGMKLLLH